MKTIDIDLKIRNIEPLKFFETHIWDLLENLINDKGISMNQKTMEHTSSRLSYFLKKNHKNLVWGEICKVFEDIAAGYYEIKYISTTDILGCFAKYQNKKIEQNRIDYEKREQQLQKNTADLNKTPYGQAILFRKKMLENGEKQWEDVPLKEIAKKIASREINFKYKTPKSLKLNNRI